MLPITIYILVIIALATITLLLNAKYKWVLNNEYDADDNISIIAAFIVSLVCWPAIIPITIILGILYVLYKTITFLLPKQ